MFNISLRRRMIEMAVGEQIPVSIELYCYNTIRNYASDLGFSMQRKYTAKKDKTQRNNIIITRIA